MQPPQDDETVIDATKRVGFVRLTRAYGIGLVLALVSGIIGAALQLTDVPDDWRSWMRLAALAGVIKYLPDLMTYISYVQRCYGPESLRDDIYQ